MDNDVRGPAVYESCEGVGQRVSEVIRGALVPGPGRVGGDGEGTCCVCERVVSQRGGIAKRHRDKRAGDPEATP